MLLELGVEFEVEEIITRSAGMETPAFRALSERAKIPLLEHEGLMIGESAAIVLYLADRFRDRLVLAPAPSTPPRARHDELCWFAMTEMDAILYTIRRHEGLPEVYGESKVAASAAREYFLRSAGELERRLAKGSRYLHGEAFTVADLLVKTCLDWSSVVCGIQLPPMLAEYSGAIASRPAYGAAMKMNFPPAAMAAISGAPKT